MATVHTAYGPGTIVDRETVRGRTQYKVAGDGFEVWLDEAKIASQLDDPYSSNVVSGGWHNEHSDEHAPIFEEEFPDHPLVENPGMAERYHRRRGDDFDDFDEHQQRMYESRRRQAWAPLDRDNSTTLPYNPEPQHNSIDGPGFDDGSSTIQPIHHIDADERLSPSDSVTFDDEDYGDEPGPNPDLFAKESAFDREAVVDSLLINHPKSQEVLKKVVPRKLLDGWQGHMTGMGVAAGSNLVTNQAEQVIDAVSPGAGWGDLIKSGSRHEAIGPAAILPALLRTLGPSVAGGLLGGDNEGPSSDPTADMAPGDGWGDLVKDGSYRPAGLSDKYIDLTASADYHNDPVAQFRHDPDAYINRIGHLMDEGLNPRFAEYMDLVEADSGIRTAAWKDVRKKAMRLKTSGAVHVKDIAPSRIMASVDGDHGTYDVVILKGASYGGLSGGQSIANWHCGCEWGRWAFKRKFSYVGRLCSHAYASYLTMQSAALRGQERPQRRSPSDGVIVKRQPKDRYLPTFQMAAGRRTADNLQNGPQRLTPDMVVNDTDDAHIFLDVTKDEREDTGPDDVMSEKDIVHFARLMRHCEVTERPYPRELVAFLSRYAGCVDDTDDDTQADYEAHDAANADKYLDKIRSDADRKQEEDFGSMADRVHAIQDAVEEARAHGVDADRFVAMRKEAVPGVGFDNIVDSEGNPRTTPAGAPGSKSPFKGLPEKFISPTDLQPGSAVRKQLDTEDPSGASRRNEQYGDGKPADPYANDPAANLPDKVYPARTPQTGGPAAPQQPNQGTGNQGTGNQGTGNQGNQGTGNQGNQGTGNQGTGNQGNQGTGSGKTTGPVSDGGRAGAENGNNEAIKGNEYTVQAGDTLTDIAQRAYGDMNRYQEIADANGITDVDNLEVGKTFKLDNAQGNNGVSGDVTNPAGGGQDKNPATADAGPSVETGLGGLSTAQGFAGTTPKATTDAVAQPGGDTGANSPISPAMNTPGSTSADSPTGAGVQSPAVPSGVDQIAQSAGMTPSQLTSTDLTPAPAAGGQPQARLHRRQANPATPADPNASAAAQPADPARPASAPASNPATTNPSTSSATAGGTSSPSPVGPDKASDTYDPNDPTQNQAPQGTGANRNDGTQSQPGNQTDSSSGLMDSLGLGGGMDLGDIGGLVGQISDIASPIASGIGDAIGGIASGLGSIFASREDFNDWVRYAYPADGGDDFDPKTMPHIPFAGSGNPGPLEFGTSEEYADKARKKMDDVTDLGDGDLTQSMGDWQRQAGRGQHEWWNDPSHPMYVHPRDRAESVDELTDDDDDSYREASIGYSTDDDSDIVRTFQAHLGETALGAGAGGGSGRFDDIAGAAAGFLRTAGRNYSLAEQDELVREGDKGGARNLASLDLSGTHYEDMTTLGW